MRRPLVSIVVPAYNQGEFLSRTLQSVFSQTYQKLEVIVVDDASTDNTTDVVNRYNDPRLRYIGHDSNQRLSATRNTGIRASRGSIIFLLDADDLFHQDKVQSHVDFLERHPDVGVSYNSRWELNHSSETVREMWEPPEVVGLEDLLLAFPFAPSDMVIRRQWLFRVGLFDPGVRTAEDTDLPCRLALAGCRFARINRPLNCRRHHSGREIKNLQGRLDDVRRVQETIFSDARCPEDVRAIGPGAIKHHLMVVTFLAFFQRQPELARQFLNELVRLDPSVLSGQRPELIEYLFSESVADESIDHRMRLRQCFDHLPTELQWLSSHYDWCATRGYLWKALRAVIWGRRDEGDSHFADALERGARLDRPLMQRATHQLLLHEREYGDAAAREVLSVLSPYLERLSRRSGRRLEASYLVNRAFELYRAGRYGGVLPRVLGACRSDARLAMNRGVVSIFLRSLVKSAA